MDVEIARVRAQRLLCCAAAQARISKIAKNLFSDCADGAMQFAAQRGLVHADHTGNFGMGAPVDIVGRQQKLQFRILAAQRLFNRIAQQFEFSPQAAASHSRHNSSSTTWLTPPGAAAMPCTRVSSTD